MNILNMNYLKPNFFSSLLRIGRVEGCSGNGKIISRFCVKKNHGNKNCWKCGKNLKDVLVFCDQCSSLQRVGNTSNYFEILGVDYDYDVSLSEISKKYKNLQSHLHPDKFGNKTQRCGISGNLVSSSKKGEACIVYTTKILLKEEKSISEEYSALVNKAYSTLINPLERGLYMLQLNGISIEEDKKEMDKLFLMEILEINEEIENEKDADKLRQLNKTNKDNIDSLKRKVQEAFEEHDMKKATDILTKMKYYYTIDSKIKELKQKLGIPD